MFRTNLVNYFLLVTCFAAYPYDSNYQNNGFCHLPHLCPRVEPKTCGSAGMRNRRVRIRTYADPHVRIRAPHSPWR